MKKRKQLWTGILAGIGMLILILDAKCAVSGAADGIQLCIRCVIPSLFPFLILSNLINNALLGRRINILSPIRKLCGIPQGSESLLLLGLLGGYPVGAQVVSAAYKSGHLPKQTAERMLGFCNNAGPAFIFGLIGALFTSISIPWVIWFIHMLSALAVGIILPNKSTETCSVAGAKPLSITDALKISITIMANICGWVVIFRMIIAICNRWFLWLLPGVFQGLLAGILELTNGITVLQSISAEGARFVLSTCMLSFGGICVGMQTYAVTSELNMTLYFPGKLLQAIISFFLSAVLQVVLFDHSEILQMHSFLYVALITVFVLTVLYLRLKKSSDKRAMVVV